MRFLTLVLGVSCGFVLQGQTASYLTEWAKLTPKIYTSEPEKIHSIFWSAVNMDTYEQIKHFNQLEYEQVCAQALTTGLDDNFQCFVEAMSRYDRFIENCRQTFDQLFAEALDPSQSLEKRKKTLCECEAMCKILLVFRPHNAQALAWLRQTQAARHLI